LAGKAILGGQTVLPVHNEHPPTPAICIEPRSVERTLVEQLAVLLIYTGSFADFRVRQQPAQSV